MNRSCQRPPFPRLFHLLSPMSTRVRSTTSFEIIAIMLYLVSSIFTTSQIRRGAIQIARMMATPEVWLIAVHQRRLKKRTVNAGSKIREPCNAGDGDYDFIPLPNCHTERAVVSQKAQNSNRQLTCEERLAMMQIRILNT